MPLSPSSLSLGTLLLGSLLLSKSPLLSSSALEGDTTAARNSRLQLSLRDQYGERITYPLGDAQREAVVLVAASDRRGASANRDWAAELAERYARHIEGRTEPRLVILPVAHLGGVPRLLRGVVRSFFRGRNPDGEPLLPIGLDWRGDLRRQLGLEVGVPNIIVLDPNGRLVVQRAGPVTEVGPAIFSALDLLLLLDPAASRSSQ